jgi:hypothetical protein
MHLHIHGYPVAMGLLAFMFGAMTWRYRKLHRLSAIGFGLGAFFLAIGVVPWLDALSGLVDSGTGLTVLAIIDLVAGLGFWYEAVQKHMHHRIRTPVTALTFGTALMLTIGNLGRLLTQAARSAGKTARALSQSVHQIKSGQAAHAMPQHQGLVVLAAGAGILMLLIVLGHRHEHGRGSRRGGQAAIGGGGGTPILTSGGGGTVARRK